MTVASISELHSRHKQHLLNHAVSPYVLSYAVIVLLLLLFKSVQDTVANLNPISSQITQQPSSLQLLNEPKDQDQLLYNITSQLTTHESGFSDQIEYIRSSNIGMLNSYSQLIQSLSSRHNSQLDSISNFTNTTLSSTEDQINKDIDNSINAIDTFNTTVLAQVITVGSGIDVSSLDEINQGLDQIKDVISVVNDEIYQDFTNYQWEDKDIFNGTISSITAYDNFSIDLDFTDLNVWISTGMNLTLETVNSTSDTSSYSNATQTSSSSSSTVASFKKQYRVIIILIATISPVLFLLSLTCIHQRFKIIKPHIVNPSNESTDNNIILLARDRDIESTKARKWLVCCIGDESNLGYLITLGLTLIICLICLNSFQSCYSSSNSTTTVSTSNSTTLTQLSYHELQISVTQNQAKSSNIDTMISNYNNELSTYITNFNNHQVSIFQNLS
ncbi:hypothetical protein WICPIJ_003297, partial [Wickerhamomyces pijperi]